MDAKYITLIAAIVPALGYVVGYSYLDGYYEFFDISLAEIQPTTQEVFAHCAPVIGELYRSVVSSSTARLIFFLGALAASILYFEFRKSYSIDKDSIYAIIPTITPAIFIFLLAATTYSTVRIAHQNGKERAFSDLPHLNPMRISGINEAHSLGKLVEKLDNAELRHLTTTTESHFGIVSIAKGDRRWVVRIPKSDEIIMRVYQD